MKTTRMKTRTQKVLVDGTDEQLRASFLRAMPEGIAKKLRIKLKQEAADAAFEHKWKDAVTAWLGCRRTFAERELWDYLNHAAIDCQFMPDDTFLIVDGMAQGDGTFHNFCYDEPDDDGGKLEPASFVLTGFRLDEAATASLPNNHGEVYYQHY